MKTILAFIDFSDAAPEVVRVAGQVARAFGATAYLIHVTDPDSDYDGDELRTDISRRGVAAEIRRKHRAVRIAATSLKKMGTDVVALLVRGTPVKKALQELDRRNPDLVVVGRHKHGRLYQLLPGQVGAAVARSAECPVLMVPVPGKVKPAASRPPPSRAGNASP